MSELRSGRRCVSPGCSRSGAWKLNSVPSSHMVCMTLASFLATATTARLWPRRWAIFKVALGREGTQVATQVQLQRGGAAAIGAVGRRNRRSGVGASPID